MNSKGSSQLWCDEMWHAKHWSITVLEHARKFLRVTVWIVGRVPTSLGCKRGRPLQQDHYLRQLCSESLNVLQKDLNIRCNNPTKPWKLGKKSQKVLFGEIYQYFVKIFDFVLHKLKLDHPPEILRSENTNASFQGLFSMIGIPFFPPQVP